VKRQNEDRKWSSTTAALRGCGRVDLKGGEGKPTSGEGTTSTF
jgi:hypothetical protein